MNTTTTPTPMEILAMARELLLDRYLEEKAKVLMKWQILNSMSWQTTGNMLPYPELPGYPTQEEIMALAAHLQEYFSEMNHDETQNPSDETTMTETWSVFEPAPEPVVEPAPAPVVEPTVESTPQAAPIYVMNMNPETGAVEVVNAAAQQPAQPA